MKGKISFSAKNKFISFRFDLERNITVITGDSGTGKTKLVNMVRAYATEGKGSGVTLKCSKPCVVLEGSNWELQLQGMTGSVVFIEESTKFLPSYEFAKAIQKTDNYYVLITREPLPQIPYSIDAIKTISKNERTPKIEKIYKNVGVKDITHTHYEAMIIEDAKAGFQFFSKVGEREKIPCISSDGKSNLITTLNEQTVHDILVIADGAALGPEIRNLLQYIEASGKKIDLFLPESFEWLILHSAVFHNNKNVRQILEHPVEYIESKDYFSWEQFFTWLLYTESKDRQNLNYPFDKSKLPSGYLVEANMDSILNAANK